MDRAEKFYNDVTGHELSSQEDKMPGYVMSWFPMDMEATGSAGTLMQGEGYTPTMDGVLVYLTVASIDDALAKVEENGGKVVLPKKDIGEHGSIAWFSDTEGNKVALHEAKAK